MFEERFSIITPSYERHASQYFSMLESIKKNCIDISRVDFCVILERKNNEIFKSFFKKLSIKNYKIINTESILQDFGNKEHVDRFLKRVGKFTFQSVKKLGAFKYIKTDWSIILDSESIFVKKFSISELVNNYREQKYVFYTKTKSRGDLWNNSLGHQVNKNVSSLLSMDCTTRWFMEYFHWFYETKKVEELLHSLNKTVFMSYVRGVNKNYSEYLYEGRHVDFFENIIYYNFLWKKYSHEYYFYDMKEEIDKEVDPAISGRFILEEMPFSLFGNDYILNIVAPEEIAKLSGFFRKFKLPFVRLEPVFFDSHFVESLRRLPYLVATISSHHYAWLSKKVAVCVSGEFRHKIHRVPEQQVRMLKSFLSGVECDVYVHGWRSTSEALIINELQPKKYLFEERKSFEDLEEQIKFREPRLKPDRDLGSLSMFYSMQKSFELLEDHIDEYDFVLRIRPDMYVDISLKDLLVRITDAGDFVPNSICFPRNYHSKGINDQIAIGPRECMRTYFHTFDYIKDNIGDLFFNPESILLKNILQHNIKPVIVDIPYALMRILPFKVHDIARVMHEQEHVWWSRSDILPLSKDMTEFFSDKLRAMEGMMMGNVPDTFYILKEYFRGKAWLGVRNIDNNPSRLIALFDFNQKDIVATPIEMGETLSIGGFYPKYTFVYEEKENYIISVWTMKEAVFSNEKIRVRKEDIIMASPLNEEKLDHAWNHYNHALGRIEDFECSKKLFPSPKSLMLKFSFFLLRQINSGSRRDKFIRNPILFCRDSSFSVVRLIGKRYTRELANG